MSVFRRRKKEAPVPELTNGAYLRWLRAGQPQPLAFFLGLGEDDQEQLAQIGDDYTAEFCMGVGQAVAGLLRPEEDEETRVRRLAVAALSGLGGAKQAAMPAAAAAMPTSPRETMAGVLAKRKNGRSLFGKEPTAASEGDE